MSAKHTPGPWEWKGYGLAPVSRDPDTHAIHTILEVENFAYGFVGSDLNATLAEDNANRALIAAAPELLDNLEALFLIANDAGLIVSGSDLDRDIRAAIAKAEVRP